MESRVCFPRLALLAALVLAIPARADFKVDSPQVEEGGPTIESSSSYGRDRNPTRDRELSVNNSLGYGFTPWWFTELDTDVIREPGEDAAARYEAFTWKNTFHLARHEATGIDLGAELLYTHLTLPGSPEAVAIGGLAQKEWGRLSAILNLFLEQEIGRGASGGVDGAYAIQVKWRFDKALGVAVETFADLGKLHHIEGLDEQDHRLGPVLSGTFDLGDWGAIGYEAGYLFGLTRAAPDGTIKWLLNYTFPF